MDIRRLWSLHEFYHHLLGIPDIDLQTVAWERVVEGLMKLRNANVGTADVLPRFVKQQANYQSKQRMDAHDIANRLMRRDNYFVALFNKELLDLSLPVPFLGERHFYSSSLEFCLKFCFHDFIFDESGQVKPGCLKKQDRHILVQTLRSRLRAIALISIVAAPINIGAHCAYYFSRYYAVRMAFLISCSAPTNMSFRNIATALQDLARVPSRRLRNGSSGSSTSLNTTFADA